MDELIRKMQQDMEIQNYSPRTVEAYLFHVKRFQLYLHKPLDQVTVDDIRSYLYHVKKEKHYSRSSLHQAFSAIKYLYRHTLKMPIELRELKGPKRDQKLPLVLSANEIHAILNRTGNNKHRLVLMTLYSGGLRLNEGIHLRITDIDSQRMTIRVRQGKGNRDRYTLLSTVLLKELRLYWLRERPDPWLFPGQKKNKPLSETTIQKAFQRARQDAGIRKEASVHTLRHSFATHLLEQGVNLFTIKELLGHKSIRSTLIYLHLQKPGTAHIVNPLDQLLPGLK